MSKKIFVSPFNKAWKIKTIGTKKSAGVYKTKSKAVKQAIEIAKKQKAELFVQNKDGKIGWKNSYGNDPRHIKG